jgi:hypothetical protein
MKKVISLFLLSFVLLGIMQAQETKYVSGGLAREMALGGSPSNAYMMDYTDVYTNPAWAIKYSDFIYSELGYNYNNYHAAGQSAGFTYAVSKFLAVGLSIGKQEGPMFQANSYGHQLGGNVSVSDDILSCVNYYISGFTTYSNIASDTWRPLEAYAALKLSRLTLGFGIYRVSWSGSTDFHSSGDTLNTTDEATFRQTGFKAGALLDMDVMLIDVSALLRLNSVDAKHTPPPAVPLSLNQELTFTGTELGLNARVFMKISDKFSLVPMARFYSFVYEPELTYAVPAHIKLNSKPNKFNRTDFEAGIGTNVNINGGKVFAGLSLESISLKRTYTTFKGTYAGSTTAPDSISTQVTDTYTTSVLTLPKVSLGAEFEIASWLTGRLGYYKAFASQDVKTEYNAKAKAKTEETKYTFDFGYAPACSLQVADELLSLGIGLHFDRLSIDGYLAEEWLADGIYIASGKVNAMFCVVSMSYSFN